MTRPRRRPRLALLLVVVLGLADLTACGEESSTTDSSTLVSDGLQRLPRSIPADATLMFVDLDRSTASAGSPRPGPDAGEASMSEWLRQVVGPQTGIRIPEGLGTADGAVREALGFDLRDVSRLATARYAAGADGATGSFTALAMTADAQLRGGLPVNGGIIVSEDAEPGARSVDGRPPAVLRPVMGLRQERDLILLSDDATRLTAWGTPDSLADDSTLSAMATALDTAGAQSVQMVRRPATNRPPRARGLGGARRMPAFTAVSIGQVPDGGAPRERVVYAVDDPQDARPRIEAVWRATRSLPGVTVSSVEAGEGVVIVDLVSERPGAAITALTDGEPPFIAPD